MRNEISIKVFIPSGVPQDSSPGPISFISNICHISYFVLSRQLRNMRAGMYIAAIVTKTQ